MLVARDYSLGLRPGRARTKGKDIGVVIQNCHGPS